ncbi:MAG: hypothetical protein Q4D96_01875 [Propionibacteriaceae bacterium]|nr:hypothetical protein [Propionibacteriaceae bacterium]
MRRITTAAVACVLLFGAFTAAHPAQAEENPCDPANGRYTCDGSEDQPDGDARPYWKYWKKPKLPHTGVSALSQPGEGSAAGIALTF